MDKNWDNQALKYTLNACDIDINNSREEPRSYRTIHPSINLKFRF